MSKCKSGPFEHAQSMSKWPAGSAYVGNFINYLLYLPDPFLRGLCIDLEGSSTFLLLMLLMHIDRLGLFSHLHRILLNCLSTCLGSWVGAIVLYREAGCRCTISVSAGCSLHQLPGCKCAGFYAPFEHKNGAYMGIYDHMQLYIHAFTCIYKLKTYMYALFCNYWNIYLHLNASV